MSRIKSVHEVYFLVRVGQMSEDDLNTWLQDSINATICDEQDIEDYEREWDDLEPYDC